MDRKKDLTNYYNEFIASFKVAHPDLKGESRQRLYNAEWKELKAVLESGDESTFKKRLLQLKVKARQFKADNSIETFFAKPAKQRQTTNEQSEPVEMQNRVDDAQLVNIIGGNFRQDFHHFRANFMLFSGYFHVHLKLKKLMAQPPGKKALITKK